MWQVGGFAVRVVFLVCVMIRRHWRRVAVQSRQLTNMSLCKIPTTWNIGSPRKWVSSTLSSPAKTRMTSRPKTLVSEMQTSIFVLSIDKLEFYIWFCMFHERRTVEGSDKFIFVEFRFLQSCVQCGRRERACTWRIRNCKSVENDNKISAKFFARENSTN